MSKYPRTRMGISTNPMPPHIYNLLEEKGKQNELTTYIIDLVQQDVEKREVSQQFQQMMDGFRLLLQEIQGIQQELQEVREEVRELKRFTRSSETVSSNVGESLISDHWVPEEEVKASSIHESFEILF